ncbi:MAG TPA: hypothetical protein VJ746_02785 [Nitrospira sp.]|nr:hypothetical protein [Nitrospira sp.]
MMQAVGDAIGTVRSLLRHPHVDRADLISFQNRRLRGLVKHAYEKIPYYRHLFDKHRVKAEDIRTVDDLTALPITERSDLQTRPVSEFLAQGLDPSRLITRSSSGSSGKPITVCRTWLEERLHGAIWFRTYSSLGRTIFDKHAFVIGIRTPQPQDNRMTDRLLSAVRAGRQTEMDALQPPEEILSALLRYKPAVVSGYPGILARLAQTVDRNKLRSLHVRFVTTGGETLTPLMREQIEQAFSVPVYDTYGSIEFHALGWQCPVTSDYHVCDDGLILEVVRGGTPVPAGERGEVVGTDLLSFAMPLIRYRLGDVVTKGSDSCLCGRPFSTIRSIQGRVMDYFALPGDRVVHPYEFGLIKVPWIREFQIIQNEMDSIVMQVVPFHCPSTAEMQSLIQPIAKIVGSDVRFAVNLVESIPSRRSGKFQVYRSLVRSVYGDGEEGRKES